ncbi:hypothetical protein CsSME_00020358 [Camellia sinensis var. sinensis]
MDMNKNTYMYPSFATSILDEIYRSMDGGNEKCQELKFYNNRVVKIHLCTHHSLPVFSTKSVVPWTARTRNRVRVVESWTKTWQAFTEHVSSSTRNRGLLVSLQRGQSQ